MADKKQKQKKARQRTSAKDWSEKQSQGESTCLVLPEGAERLDLKEGVFRLDIIPYEVTKEGNRHADPGFVHFERTYEAHRIMGPDGKVRLYPCLWFCWGKTCPVCQWLNLKGGQADPELVKRMRATTRHLWNVINCDDRAKGIQILDTNHYNRGRGFGEMLQELIKDSEDDVEDFCDPVKGFTLKVRMVEEKFPGGKYYAPTRMSFIPRKKPYDESIIDKAFDLDAMLVEHSSEALLKLLEQGTLGVADDDADDDDEDEAPRSRKSRALPISKRDPNDKRMPPPEPDDEDDEDEDDEDPNTLGVGSKVKHKKFGECQVIKAMTDGTFVIEDEDGKAHKGIKPADLTLLAASDDDDEDDDDFEDEDDDDFEDEDLDSEEEDGDDDEDDDDDDFEDDEDEDDDDDIEDKKKPAPKKKAASRPRK